MHGGSCCAPSRDILPSTDGRWRATPPAAGKGSRAMADTSTMQRNNREHSVILSACRTPFGKLGGALASLGATDLGGIVIKEAIARAGIAPEEVEHILMGQVVQAGAGQNPLRPAGFQAGAAPALTPPPPNPGRGR